MLVVYNGAHPEVVVDALNQEQVITAGVPVDVPDDLAASLLEQSTWSAADKKAEKVQATIDATQDVPAPEVTTDTSAPAGDATDDTTKDVS